MGDKNKQQQPIVDFKELYKKVTVYRKYVYYGLVVIALGLLIFEVAVFLNTGSLDIKFEKSEVKDASVLEEIDALKQRCRFIKDSIYGMIKEMGDQPQFKDLLKLAINENWNKRTARLHEHILKNNDEMEGFYNDEFIDVGSKRYRQFYGNWLAGFHGSGCHTKSCDVINNGKTVTIPGSSTLEECIASCSDKRISDDITSLSFDGRTETCYCSKKNEFYEAEGYLHYRFQKF